MTKVHGKRYAYKFDFHALMQACQNQTHESAGYKYSSELSGLFSTATYPQCPKLNGLIGHSSQLHSSLHQQGLFHTAPTYWSPSSVVSGMYTSPKDSAPATPLANSFQTNFANINTVGKITDFHAFTSKNDTSTNGKHLVPLESNSKLSINGTAEKCSYLPTINL